MLDAQFTWMCHTLPRLSFHQESLAPPWASCLRTWSFDEFSHCQARTLHSGFQNLACNHPSPLQSFLLALQNLPSFELPKISDGYLKKKQTEMTSWLINYFQHTVQPSGSFLHPWWIEKKQTKMIICFILLWCVLCNETPEQYDNFYPFNASFYACTHLMNPHKQYWSYITWFWKQF